VAFENMSKRSLIGSRELPSQEELEEIEKEAAAILDDDRSPDSPAPGR
jgi:hypothetical protein